MVFRKLFVSGMGLLLGEPNGYGIGVDMRDLSADQVNFLAGFMNEHESAGFSLSLDSDFYALIQCPNPSHGHAEEDTCLDLYQLLVDQGRVQQIQHETSRSCTGESIAQ